MMTPEDVGTLLMRIAAIDNRTITPETAAAWELMLKPYVTLTDATQAYIDFYADPQWADNPRRPWIMPADINRRVAQMRDRRRASDVDIEQAMEGRTGELGTLAEHQARQQVKRLTANGVSLVQAVSQAVEAARRKQLEAPQQDQPAKPRPKRYHFAGHGQTQIGAMSLKDTLGGAA